MKAKYNANTEPRQMKVLNNVICKVQRLDIEDKTTNTISRRRPSNLEDDIVRYPMKIGNCSLKTIVKKQKRQLPVIAAILPSLALNELAMVTALDRRVGSVFYLDAVYGSTKGAITANDTLSNAQTGHDRTISGRRYASDMVRQEPILDGSGDPVIGAGSVSYTVSYAATGGINRSETGTIIIRDSAGTIVAQDTATPGTLVPVAGGLVTITSGSLSANGVLTLVVGSGTDSGGLTIDYWYKFDMPVDAYNNKKGVPELDIDMRSETVTAHDFPIRSKFSVGAGIDLQRAHGISLETELVKFLGNEVKFGLELRAIAA